VDIYIILLLAVIIILLITILIINLSKKENREENIVEDIKEKLREENYKLSNTIIKEYGDLKVELATSIGKGSKENIKDLNEFKEGLNKDILDNFQALNKKIEEQMEGINKKVEYRLNEGFEKTNKTFTNIVERLTKIDEAQKNIEKLSSKYKLHAVMSRTGHSAKSVAKQYGAKYATTNYEDILNDKDVDLVMIATRHDSHATLTLQALEAGKHVFVEKPLAIDMEQLADVVKVCKNLAKEDKLPHLMVGFNRRFSPFIEDIYNKTKGRSSGLAMNMTINAGALPKSLWVHDPKVGGGRIIGEGCHFIDTMSFLSSSNVTSVYSTALNQTKELAIKNDNVILNMKFEDGSIGTLSYLSNGNKSFSKEQMILFCEGKVLSLDNYKKNSGYGTSDFKKFSQDKGHKNEMMSFINNIKSSSENLISLESLVNTTLATFAHVKSLEENREVKISELEKELSELIK